MTSKMLLLQVKLPFAIWVLICSIVTSHATLPLHESHEPVLLEGSIGHYMLTHPPSTHAAQSIAQTAACTDLKYNIDASNLNRSAEPCVVSRRLVPRRRRLPSRSPIFNTYSYSATYDDGNGNGYNITYPTQLCSNSVVGDVMSPLGYVVENATLQSVYTSLAALPSDHLYTYTTTILERALSTFSNAIEPILCDPPSGGLRALLTRYTASQVSGRWVAGLTGTVGLFGVIFGTVYVPVVHPGITANITKTEDVIILAASATIGTLFFWALERLHKAEVTNVVEAFIFTLLVSAGETFVDALKATWSGVCTTTSILIKALGNFLRQTEQETVVVGGPAGVAQAGAQEVQPVQPAQQGQPEVPAQVEVGNVCS